MTKNEVEILTLTFRDGLQSTGLWDDYFRLFRRALQEWKIGSEGEAISRLRRIATLVKETGFSGAEVFWGQSFQKLMLANINPFEAIELCREVFGADFMLSGLGRGINAVGFRPYGQDVIDTLVERFAERGGVPGKKLLKMRIFDALNNIQNCSSMISAAIRNNQKTQIVDANNSIPENERGEDWQAMTPVNMVHIEAALCYQPEREYDNEVLYSDDYYLEYAKKLIRTAEKAGGKLDSWAIKDMAGQLDPVRAARLVPKLTELGLPVYLHTHSTNYQQAIATMTAAADHGIAGVETVEWPLSGGTSHASVRDVMDGKGNTFCRINRDKLSQLEQELESLVGTKDKLFSEEGNPNAKRLDLRIDETSRLELWKLGIPGGAMAAVMNLLQKEVCTHKKTDLKNATTLFAVELEHLQNRIGWVPLVTPMADIIYTQAIFNLISGRDRIVEYRYARMIVGLYGTHLNHATGKRVAIENGARKAVLDYCQGVQRGNSKTPSFGQPYPKPEIVTEQKHPPLEFNEARSSLRNVLQRAEIDAGSPEADEAVVIRLMEPPASQSVTERLLLDSAQGRIQALLRTLTPDPIDWESLPIEDIQRTLEDYGGVKRAEAFSRHLLHSNADLSDALNKVSLEAASLRNITSSSRDTDSVKNAILRLVCAVLENKYLNNYSSLQSHDEGFPLGPESGLYFLQNSIDPYSSEARRLLEKEWPQEYQNRLLSNAIRKGIPLEHDIVAR